MPATRPTARQFRQALSLIQENALNRCPAWEYVESFECPEGFAATYPPSKIDLARWMRGAADTFNWIAQPNGALRDCQGRGLAKVGAWWIEVQGRGLAWWKA